MFYNARYYSPTLGRFISADTVIPGSENPQALNRYSYSISNPLKYADPSGHIATPPCIFLCTPIPISGGLQSNVAALGCLFLNCHVTRVDDNIWGDPWGGEWEIRNNGPILPMPMPLEFAPLEGAVVAAGEVTEGAIQAATKQLAQGGLKSGEASVVLGEAGTAASKAISSGISADTKAIAQYWPPNRGFIGEPQRVHLMSGELISRYGQPGGTFLAPKGTPFEMRGLPPSLSSLKPNIYQVVKPIEVLKGRSVPAFGYIGMGIQYELPVSVQTLLGRGILKEIFE
jgi:hypothetical protein